MARNVYAVWCAVGAAAVLMVVVVGFMIPSGGDENVAPVAKQTGPDGPVPDVKPAVMVPEKLDREEKAELREKWSSMSDTEREQFRQEVRQRLSESRRLAMQEQARVSQEESLRQAELLKQRQELVEPSLEGSGDDSEVQVK